MLSSISFLFYGEPYFTVALVILIGIKLLLFITTRTERWRWINLVYFDRNHILSSSSLRTQSAKKIQNYLSNLIILVGLLEISVVLFEKYLIVN
jgi:uncharacterized membrane protein YfhO